ncbi:PhzF family phenazine biosynthesis protein [Limobrevibacterium gyesilva]|uniref:PhzF family phenazine biosynthesis protein n=1 Tax=Limobrevibacterium gyesilva TaxID=2991712 RepID=A0AA42CFK4_9PROT|nr:PhzF family phenazine biosynthesis protein [Limobrevibacterium gyesilva]MCW3474991.1 PhzF family phenazine biosynthesis protein [Limobrevibacterium gyesilva]
MKRRYVTADVFTESLFGGNPLAVVLDAEGLDGARMQAIAREFNYSETTFLLPPADPAHTAHVRIFTPGIEVPFAGHPNVGTAFALARIGMAFGRPVGEAVVFEEAAGLVPVRILRRDDTPAGAQLTAPQRLYRGATMPPERLAACLSLSPDDIVMRAHPPQVASVGLPFVIAELRDRAALARARPDAAAWAACLPVDDAHAIHIYTRAEPAAGCDIHARMFSVLDGTGEDPATGSANAALAALLAALSPATDTTLHLRIAQGEDMGRPSLLMTEVDKIAGVPAHVRVGGYCVAVMEGVLEA